MPNNPPKEGVADPYRVEYREDPSRRMTIRNGDGAVVFHAYSWDETADRLAQSLGESDRLRESLEAVADAIDRAERYLTNCTVRSGSVQCARDDVIEAAAHLRDIGAIAPGVDEDEPR